MNIKKYFVIVVILSLFVFVIFLFIQRSSLNTSDKSTGSTPIPFLKNLTSKATIEINNIEIDVDIADSVALQTKGLSGRSVLNEEEGMLFIFPDDKIRYFWMKDMLFPIDIIWIDKEGRIIGIEENAPKPEGSTPDYKLSIYSSPKPVPYVLEVNAGFSERNNIKVNDIVEINQ
jgi:uncharacterized membrane protein (UPF0127 family)